jgi:CDP-6-deoxy-D-xylo-4-hexulose-3-dehydrase
METREFVTSFLEGNLITSVHNGEFKKEDGKMKVYYSGPYWDYEEVSAAIETLLTGKWLASGEKVYKFERAFSKKFNAESSLMVNSGSSANLVMLGALKKYFEWGDDAEIIVSPVGFPTTIAPIAQNNLVPVFADIEMDTLNFDLEEVLRKITPQTVAIMLSPVLGNPPHMDALIGICEDTGIELILDNCDSLGTTWGGQYLNEYAVAASCSFYPAHHITTAEGGMVSAKKEIIEIARSLAWWGRDCYCVGSANLLSCGTCGKRFDNWLPEYNGEIDHKYVFTHMGYNLKPLDLQGAMGLEQLKKFDDIHNRRRNSKMRLHSIMEKHQDLRVPEELYSAQTSWFGTPIICPANKKSSLVAHLEENLIQTIA